jgi:ribosomal protein S18 acetylase RimI-like enzyme
MLTIERATVGDVDLVKQLLSETWVATYADHLSPSTVEQVTTHWHDPRLLRSQIEKSGDFFAVAKDDGKILGIITVIAVSREELHLARLYVRPEHQGKGVGSRLLAAAIESYPDAKVVRLKVEQQNTKSHSYWRNRKFFDTGTSVEQVGTDRMTVVSMERRLE